MALSAALHRYLIVLESGALSGVALRAGVKLARCQAAELVFVHRSPLVADPGGDVLGGIVGSNHLLNAEIQKQALHCLAWSGRFAARAGLKSRGISLPAGARASDIARIAAQQHCELIVIAHGGGHALMQCLANSLIPGLVALQAPPVLICRPPAR